MIKKILFIFLSLFYSLHTFASLEESMLPDAKSIMDDEEGLWMIDVLLNFVRNSVFWLLALIAIAMFIFVGAKLITARWDQEQFKKAMMMFLYTIIWLFIVAASWVAVQLIAWLDIN